jgi:hypothetical protein
MLLSIRTALIVVALASAWPTAAVAVVPQPCGPSASRPVVTPVAPAPRRPAPRLDGLMVFGAGAVLLMLVCRGHEGRFPSAAAGTAAAALAASAYGFAQGAWPLGIALAAFAAVAIRRWGASRGIGRRCRRVIWLGGDGHLPVPPVPDWHEESRLARLFGRP